MDEFLDKLPESLQIIVRLTDLSTALTLVKRFGGTNLHFPPLKLVNDRHELAALIGVNNLRQLAQYYEGDTVYMPLASHYGQFLRDEKIKQDSSELSTSELARKYHVSDRWVREIKRRHKPALVKREDKQIDMFE